MDNPIEWAFASLTNAQAACALAQLECLLEAYKANLYRKPHHDPEGWVTAFSDCSLKAGSGFKVLCKPPLFYNLCQLF